MPIKVYKLSTAGTKDFTERWSNVMNGFYSLYHHWKNPLKKGQDVKKEEIKIVLYQYFIGKLQINPVSSTLEEYFNIQLNLFLDRVDRECSHSDFLWSLREPIFELIIMHSNQYLDFNFRNNDERHIRKIIKRRFNALYEEICIKIQLLASNYYVSMWQSLGRDEQRTLYDIALDEMVNPANRDIADRLAGLGLISPVENIACFEVMNTSFRNFIYSKLDTDQVSSFKIEASEKGSWNSVQLPIMIVVLGLGIFLFVTQRDAFTNLVTYLGAAIGGIAALLKVLGMIPSTKN
jgi:hypothetical protein